MKKRLLVLLLIVCFFYFPIKQSADANETSLPSVTVINPIRGPQLGLENRDLLKSLEGQWQAVHSADIPATWLWQYSALEDKSLVDFAKLKMKNQEFGIFLEVDKNSADKAGVTYHSKGPWYFSDGLLIVSYDQFEREKLIDKVFETFKQTFGYYPKSVGAWWVGAESIQYMQKKYGITAVLQCADQFSTDRYSLWGTPWSIPYAPSKRNAAIPAASNTDRIPNVVILQWATRDPVMAYGPGVADSVYSIQDRGEIPYVNYLKNIFLHKSPDHIAIGLESGFPPESYTDGVFQKQMGALKQWEKEGSLVLQKASDYADTFNNYGKILPPTSYFLTSGYQTEDQAFWYHSLDYRFALQKKGNNIYVIDIRDYSATPTEDFYTLPNTQSMIRINTKAVLDTIRFPSDKILLAKSDKPLIIKEDGNKVSLFTNDKLVAQFTPTELSYYSLINKDQTKTLTFADSFPIGIGDFFILIVLLYIFCTCYFYRKKTDHMVISIFCLLLLLIVLIPIYTSGQFFDDTMRFTSVSLSLLLSFSPLSVNPTLKVALLQIIPLLLVLIFHFFATKKLKTINLLLASLVTTFIILFFLNAFDIYIFNINNFFIVGKKAKLITIASFIVIIGFLFLLVKLYRTKKENILILILIVTSVLLTLISQKQIVAEKTYLVTPFELEALERVYSKQKPVVFIQPEVLSTYQSVKPLLAQDKKYAEMLTSVPWEMAPQRQADDVFNKNNKLIVIPRYLGADLFSTDDKKDGSKKNFDNGQIGIFETN